MKEHDGTNRKIYERWRKERQCTEKRKYLNIDPWVIANICQIIEKAREFQKNIYFCFIGYAKAFDCVDHNKLWRILKEMRTSDHLTCLLRNLYAGQEATVRTGHGTTTGSKQEKERIKALFCHPAYLTSMQSTS